MVDDFTIHTNNIFLMSKIFSPTEIENDEFPASEGAIQTVAIGAQHLVEQAYIQGDIVSASSFGSLYGKNAQPNRTSDVDWLLVFQDLDRMLTSKNFAEMQLALRDTHVPFNSPALSMESVASGNHLIGPILHGVRQAAHRIIVGEDPVDLFYRHGIRKNSREILSRMFATYPRHLFEKVSAGYALAEKSNQTLLEILQSATDYFIDTYRSMIVADEPEDDFSSPVTFDVYSAKYQSKIPTEAFECGERVNQFIEEYKQTVAGTVTDISQQTDVAERQKIIATYAGFLQSYRSISRDALLFCQANIDCFQRMP